MANIRWNGTSHPCARCGTPTVRIGLGDLCPACAQDVTRKASRIGRLVAMVATLLVGGYLVVSLRSVPLAWRTTARTVGAVTVVVWYLLTYRIAKRIALEWLR